MIKEKAKTGEGGVGGGGGEKEDRRNRGCGTRGCRRS